MQVSPWLMGIKQREEGSTHTGFFLLRLLVVRRSCCERSMRSTPRNSWGKNSEGKGVLAASGYLGVLCEWHI
jgi:hypothetical protein